MSPDPLRIPYVGKIAYAVVIVLFAFLSLSAQPTPGKEKITIELPAEYRWRSNKIPKETKAIRATAYTVRGNNAENSPVTSVTVTTIDKRYYPMKAAGSPEEKWTYVKIGCPDATLDMIDQRTTEGRTAILYAIRSASDEGGDCDASVLLAYVAEGPTALHTIELYLPADTYGHEIFKMWCGILLQAEIG